MRTNASGRRGHVSGGRPTDHQTRRCRVTLCGHRRYQAPGRDPRHRPLPRDQDAAPQDRTVRLAEHTVRAWAIGTGSQLGHRAPGRLGDAVAVAGYVKVYAKRKGRLPKQLRHARLPADAKALYAGNSTNSSSSGRGHAPGSRDDDWGFGLARVGRFNEARREAPGSRTRCHTISRCAARCERSPNDLAATPEGATEP